MLAQERVSFRYTISAAEELLAPAGFLRIHKSYLVNYRAIARIQKDHVLLTDGQRLPLSKHRYQDVITGGTAVFWIFRRVFLGQSCIHDRQIYF